LTESGVPDVVVARPTTGLMKADLCFPARLCPGAAAGLAAMSLLCGRPGGDVTEDDVTDAVVAASALLVSEARAHNLGLHWIVCPGAVTVLKPGAASGTKGRAVGRAPMCVEDGVQHVVLNARLQSWC
jgi:hypothetical protein